MSKYRKFLRAAAGLGLGFTAGLMTYRGFIGEVKASGTPASFNSQQFCTGPTCPVSTWNPDWDKLESVAISATVQRERNILLVNHGEYNLNKGSDSERRLTPMGIQQSQAVARRLKALDLPYHKIITCSDMIRAKETAGIISSELKSEQTAPEVQYNEGIPAHCIPPVPNWEFDDGVMYVDSQRMEVTFRETFVRLVSDMGPTFEIIVCHPNLIRFFICRALQFPPEAWLRFSIPHCSHNSREWHCIGAMHWGTQLHAQRNENKLNTGSTPGNEA